MNCKEFSNHLIDFVEGNLSSSEEIRMKEHIKKCDKCRLKLTKIKKTIALLKEDKVPPLGYAKKNALFPLVMERLEERTIIKRKKRKWAYGLSFGFSLILVFIISLMGIRNQRKTDFYAFSINPENFIYENDTLINNYICESLLENDTLILEIEDIINNEWMDSTRLTTLLNELSNDEMDKLEEKLKDVNFNDIL